MNKEPKELPRFRARTNKEFIVYWNPVAQKYFGFPVDKPVKESVPQRMRYRSNVSRDLL